MANTNKKTNETTNDKIEDKVTETAEINSELEIVEETPSVSDVLSDINSAVGDISGNKESVQKPIIKKTSIDPNDMIPCRSLFLGKLVYTSPINGARYVWKDLGAVTFVPFSELQTMNNHKSNYLNKPLILIDNPEVVAYFNLASVYETVANINKLENIFNSANTVLIRKKVQECVSVGMRDVLIAKVRKLREENRLVDINIIRVLEEELKLALD